MEYARRRRSTRNGVSRWWGACQLILVFLAPAIATCSTVVAQEWIRTERPLNWRDDAELTDVHFVNAQLGFAVGAQGTILRTENGGQDWKVYSHVAARVGFSDLSLAEKLRKANQRQYQDFSKELDIFCRFESVSFTDEQNGWVAGGYEIPMTGRSQGVLFRTKDGGKSWREVSGIFVPAFLKLEMKKALPTAIGSSSIASGWALAKTNPLFPGSLLETTDSGNSWSTTPNRVPVKLRDAASVPGGMVVVNESGELGTTLGDTYSEAQVFGRQTAQFNAVQMFNRTQGIAVGNESAVVMTTTGGETWVDLSGSAKLTRDAETLFKGKQNRFEFRAIDVRGDFVWLVGNPGHTVFRFNRKTRELEAFPVPFGGRINQLQFVDDQHGWLVGSLGTVMATRDGGKTWVRQRGGQARVALLVVAENQTQLPLETMARYGAEEGYLTGVLCGYEPGHVNRDAMYGAVERLGNSQLELVPRAKLDPIRIAQAICAYRPTVVMIEGGIPFVERVIAGVRQARSAGNLGFEPWTPDRIAVPSLTGKVTMSTEQVLPLTGRTVGDQIAISRALLVSESDVLNQRSILGTTERRYELQGLTNAGKSQASLLFDGLKNVSRPAKRSGKSQHGNLDLIRRISQKRQSIQHLARWQTSAGRRLRQWRGEVAMIVNPLPPETAGLWLLELAETYRADGKPGLAADTLQFLVSRYPDHALSRKAQSWLVHYQSSLELAVLTKHDFKLSTVEQASANLGLTVPRTVIKDGQKKTIWVEQSRKEQLAAAEKIRTQEVSLTDWSKIRRQEASLILERSRASDPVMSVLPESRFTEAKLSEYLQPEFPNDNIYQQLAKQNSATQEYFAFASARELRVARERRQPDRQRSGELIPIHAIQSRPHLDGKLDEAFWRDAGRGSVIERMCGGERLRNSNSPNIVQVDEVRFRHDGEFLYVGLRMHKLKGQDYRASHSKRPRDPDLSQHDRVEFCLDVDRDYRSAFRFVVDHRGWVAEGCSGFRGWNPAWFVASSSDEETWSAEVAIPFEELGLEASAGDVWAIQCQRLDYASRRLWSLDDSEKEVVVSEHGILGSLRFEPKHYRLFEFE